MALITEKEFISLKQAIQNAKNSVQFNEIFYKINKFSLDNNIYTLAILFNTTVQSHGYSARSKIELYDLEHLQMLVNLREAARCVKKHIARLGYAILREDPLSFADHYHKLNAQIESGKERPHYFYYCHYFYKEIYGPLSQHHPKILQEYPSCVSQFKEPYYLTTGSPQ